MKTVSMREVAAPLPSRRPALNEQRTARPGDVLYAERSVGSPGARLTETLILKDTAAGPVTRIDPDDDLHQYLVGGKAHFCMYIEVPLYDLPPAGTRRRSKRRIGGHFMCFRDRDGDGRTFEEVRVVTRVVIVTDVTFGLNAREQTREIHKDRGVFKLPPRTYRATSVNPDGGAWYETVIMLTRIAGGTATFRAKLLDRNGNSEFRGEAVRLDLSGALPRTLVMHHPYRGNFVYRKARGGEPGRDQKLRNRAAELEILAVDGDTVTYRVTRQFMPWRYWTEGLATRATKNMRWRPRPGERLGQ